MFRKLKIVMLLAVFALAANGLQAQPQPVDWPTFTGTVHYLNLSRGTIKMTPQTVTGYGWENGTWKSVSWNGQTYGHVYYILMDPNNQFDGDPKHMSYNYVTNVSSI